MLLIHNVDSLLSAINRLGMKSHPVIKVQTGAV